MLVFWIFVYSVSPSVSLERRRVCLHCRGTFQGTLESMQEPRKLLTNVQFTRQLTNETLPIFHSKNRIASPFFVYFHFLLLKKSETSLYCNKLVTRPPTTCFATSIIEIIFATSYMRLKIILLSSELDHRQNPMPGHFSNPWSISHFYNFSSVQSNRDLGNHIQLQRFVKAPPQNKNGS